MKKNVKKCSLKIERKIFLIYFKYAVDTWYCNTLKKHFENRIKL